MFVKNWMSSPPIVIAPEVPARVALAFMDGKKIRRLPIVEKGKLLGIVTRHDLLAMLGKERLSQRGRGKRVEEAMTRNPLTVPPGETIEAAARIMLEKKISGLPVVEDGKVVGVITESDLFRMLCKLMGIAEKGARVVMSIEDDRNLLEAIQKRVNGLAVRSLATIHNAESGQWQAVVRVRGRVPVLKR